MYIDYEAEELLEVNLESNLTKKHITTFKTTLVQGNERESNVVYVTCYRINRMLDKRL